MRAGQLDQQVTLLQQNAAGDWEELRTVWAEVTTEEGSNPLRHRVRTRWKRDIVAGLRLVYRDRVLAMIGEPAQPAGRRSGELVMICTATGESASTSEVVARGALVTFTRVTQAHNATTHRLTPTTTTIAGHLEQAEPNKAAYERLGLRETEAITGRFVPTTLGDVLKPLDTVTWGGITWRVREVDTEAPDGTAVACTVVLSR